MANEEGGPEPSIFSRIAASEIPSYRVFEDDKIMAILDINPANMGHILLFPKKEYAILQQVPDDIIRRMMQTVKVLSQAQKDAFSCDGTTLFVANGAAAGQRVQHVVLHIIPRKKNDSLPFSPERHAIDPAQYEKLQIELKGQIDALMLGKADNRPKKDESEEEEGYTRPADSDSLSEDAEEITEDEDSYRPREEESGERMEDAADEDDESYDHADEDAAMSEDEEPSKKPLPKKKKFTLDDLEDMDESDEGETEDDSGKDDHGKDDSQEDDDKNGISESDDDDDDDGAETDEDDENNEEDTIHTTEHTTEKKGKSTLDDITKLLLGE
ncbi:HIT domain-containing protein [Candidatus Woesearchaeota archaeon]|nr:MAG: Hit-like protein involved in cell-cycle regulation [archaeon GW2011_AR4]MBS3129463.1 HIT domain-containing protein [Candidatus Woesearchaeota archaeon]HIH38917.1 HIT domain-containing protein [Candidatus Woesearchaeota archaeon]HIH49687.1 HIT domain-containing protein [Candidatus Woesearchaeota archaeon]HIJ03750.1 HIT domain-containing protein [Candidatus Woesearchaeota archaeon]